MSYFLFYQHGIKCRIFLLNILTFYVVYCIIVLRHNMSFFNFLEHGFVHFPKNVHELIKKEQM